jgi:hypothetical protein
VVIIQRFNSTNKKGREKIDPLQDCCVPAKSFPMIRAYERGRFVEGRVRRGAKKEGGEGERVGEEGVREVARAIGREVGMGKEGRSGGLDAFVVGGE